MVHAFCEDDISGSIARFVEEEKVTKLVMGELPEAMRKQLGKNHRENQFQRILDGLPKNVQTVIIKRTEKEIERDAAKRQII